MTAGFPSLRNDDVGTGGCCGPSFLGGADRGEHDCARITRFPDNAAGVTPKEGDDPHAGSERRG